MHPYICMQHDNLSIAMEDVVAVDAGIKATSINNVFVQHLESVRAAMICRAHFCDVGGAKPVIDCLKTSIDVAGGANSTTKARVDGGVMSLLWETMVGGHRFRAMCDETVMSG
jgi:hypothetical protein